MSILDKPLAVKGPRKRRLGLWLGLSPLVLLLLALLVIGPGTDVAFVEHFFSVPAHLTYSGHKDYISSLSWSPDGQLVASASGDHTVQLWQANYNHNTVLTFRQHLTDVSAVAISPQLS
jgi:WD40 repeat protein